MHMEKKIGFWAPPDEYPDVQKEAGNPWGKDNPLQLGAAVWHLTGAGKAVVHYKGMAQCRLCGKSLGSADMSDGAYCWPEGYEHYLMEHGVKPPDDFLAHVERLNDISPQFGPESFSQKKPNIVLEEWDKKLAEFSSAFQRFCVDTHRSRCGLEEAHRDLESRLGSVVALKFMQQAALEVETKRMARDTSSKVIRVADLDALTNYFKEK